MPDPQPHDALSNFCRLAEAIIRCRELQRLYVAYDEAGERAALDQIAAALRWQLCDLAGEIAGHA